MLIGFLATWWFGLILGLLVGLAIRSEHGIASAVCVQLRLVLRVLTAVAVSSVIGGVAGYAAASSMDLSPFNLPFLDGIINVRAAFAVGVWHDAAYASGLLATIVAVIAASRRMPPAPTGETSA